MDTWYIDPIDLPKNVFRLDCVNSFDRFLFSHPHLVRYSRAQPHLHPRLRLHWSMTAPARRAHPSSGSALLRPGSHPVQSAVSTHSHSFSFPDLSLLLRHYLTMEGKPRHSIRTTLVAVHRPIIARCSPPIRIQRVDIGVPSTGRTGETKRTCREILDVRYRDGWRDRCFRRDVIQNSQRNHAKALRGEYGMSEWKSGCCGSLSRGPLDWTLAADLT